MYAMVHIICCTLIMLTEYANKSPVITTHDTVIVLNQRIWGRTAFISLQRCRVSPIQTCLHVDRYTFGMRIHIQSRHDYDLSVQKYTFALVLDWCDLLQKR